MTSYTRTTPVMNGTFSNGDADILSSTTMRVKPSWLVCTMRLCTIMAPSPEPTASLQPPWRMVSLPTVLVLSPTQHEPAFSGTRSLAMRAGFPPSGLSPPTARRTTSPPHTHVFRIVDEKPRSQHVLPWQVHLQGRQMERQTGHAFVMWWAPKPDRIMMYPNYNDPGRGFAKPYKPKLRKTFRIVTNDELKPLRTDYTRHLDVLKKLKVTAVTDVNTFRCAEMLTASSEVDLVPGKTGYTRSGRELKDYPGLAFNAKAPTWSIHPRSLSEESLPTTLDRSSSTLARPPSPLSQQGWT